MGEIQIGTRIAEQRKKRGITQEELANHLGVSKPAVSKWESGQSYPDILLLPVLAAFFNISIDGLIGYEPQMAKEDIRKLYQKLASEFTKEPFDKVFAECREYLKKYFSCWQLQVQIGLLFINHASLTENLDKTKEVIEAALEIFKKVEKCSNDVNLAKQSVHLQALCYISLQQPAMAIDILENLKEPIMNPEFLLVKAYQMKGDTDKALEYLQGYTYVNLMGVLSAAADFFQMYADNPDKMERFYQIFSSLSNIFDIEQLHPAMLIQVNITAAYAYAGQGNKEKAMDSLEYCMELLNKIGHGKLVLHGNDIFDKLEQYFTDIDIEAAAPRNTEAILQDCKNIISQNPFFDVLKSEERYQHIIKSLK